MPNVCASSTALIVQSFRRWGRQEGYVASCDIVIATILVKFPHSALTSLLFNHSEITYHCDFRLASVCEPVWLGSFSYGVGSCYVTLQLHNITLTTFYLSER